MKSLMIVLAMASAIVAVSPSVDVDENPVAWSVLGSGEEAQVGMVYYNGEWIEVDLDGSLNDCEYIIEYEDGTMQFINLRTDWRD